MYFNLLVTQPELAYLLAIVIGLCIGSFINVVAYRLPAMVFQQQNSPQLNLAHPRSQCPHCNKPLNWYENIPLISFIIQKGLCRHCQQHISYRYPLVEILFAMIATMSVYHFGVTELGISFCIFSALLLATVLIDIEHQLILDKLSYPLLWIGLLVNSYSIYTTLHLAVFGALAGYLFFWGVYWVFKLLTGKEGLGYGDLKLTAALGAWCGLNLLPVIITIAAIMATLIGLLLILINKQNRNNPIPFAPYLATAGVIALLWGNQITNAYIQLL